MFTEEVFRNFIFLMVLLIMPEKLRKTICLWMAVIAVFLFVTGRIILV